MATEAKAKPTAAEILKSGEKKVKDISKMIKLVEKMNVDIKEYLNAIKFDPRRKASLRQKGEKAVGILNDDLDLAEFKLAKLKKKG